MKKTLCWFLVLAMLVAMAPAVFATTDTSSMLAGPTGAENDTAESAPGNNGAESENPGDSETPGGSENEGAETPAGNALVNGSNTLNLAGNEPYVEYTYTAQSAGTLTIEFTEIGYEGSAGYATWDIGERFTGKDGMAILFKAYLNGEQLSELYKGSISVAAGETVTLKWEFTATSNFLYKNAKSAKVNVSLTAGGAETPDVDQPTGGNVINVETTDNYGYFDEYTFEAPVSGEYTFNIPAGLGFFITGESRPVIDFYDNENGYDYTVELAAGAKLTFQIGALVKDQWQITYTVVEKEVEVPGGDVETPDVTGEAIGIGTNSGNVDTLYVFTATEDGVLKIDVTTGSYAGGGLAGSFYSSGWLILEVDGVAIDGLQQGIHEIAVVAGQSVTIQVVAKWQMFEDATPNIVLTLTPGGSENEGTDTPGGSENEGTDTPGGSENEGTDTPASGLIIGTNNIAGDVEYTYTATAEGTLTINAVGGKVEVGTFGVQNVVAYYYQNNALQLIVNGEIVDGVTYKGVATVDLKAGDSVTIKIGYGNEMYKNAEIVLTLSFEEGSVGGGDVEGPGTDVDGPGTDVEQPGDNEEPEVGSGSGTQADPIILSSENQTVDHAGGDLYYQWIAPADGTLKVTFNGGACLLSGSSVGSWETIDGGRMLEVAKGDKISINFWNGTAFTIAFEEASEEFNGILLDTATVELKRGGASLYAWTATADGKFIVEIKSNTFSYGYTLKVNGQSMGYGTNELILDVKAGDLIIVEFTTNAGASTDWVMTLSGEMDDGTCRHEYVDGVCIKCGEAKEPDGTQDYPFIIGNENATYAYESTPAWFQFAAEADTTLTIKTDKTKWHMVANATIDGASVSPTRVTDGNYYVYTIEVKAGSVLKFRVNATSSAASEMIVEVQQELPCQHTNTAERQENVNNATCSAGGSYDKVTYCADCQEVISTENITTSPLQHTPAERQENVNNATCTAGGSYDKVTYCSVCGTVISTEHITTSPLQHTYENGTCTGCGAEDPNYVPEQPEQPGDNENPGTGSMDMMAIVLIAMMSVVAIVSVSTKKAYKA